MPRHLIRFDVRVATSAPLEDVVTRVSAALGCTFHEGRVEQVPSMVAEVLGLSISIQPWRGMADSPIFRVRSHILDPRWVEGIDPEEPQFHSTDISAYVADLLSLTTAFEWYMPSEEDREAEREFGARLDDTY
jgi:hypothetical protein